jgi:hypothetical protein
MTRFLIDFDNNINEFNQDKIIIDDRIKINEDNYKYLLYYDNNNSANEIFLKTPKIKVLYDFTNIKYSQLKLRITPKYEKTENFINYIHNIEEYIQNHKMFKKKSEFSSLLEKEKNTYYIKSFYNNVKITSSNGKKYEFNEIKANGEVQLVIKLNNIWVKNDKYGLSSQIYQIQYYPPPEEEDYDFFKQINKIQYVPNPPSISDIPEKQTIMPSQMLKINPDLLKSVKLRKVNN